MFSFANAKQFSAVKKRVYVDRVKQRRYFTRAKLTGCQTTANCWRSFNSTTQKFRSRSSRSTDKAPTCTRLSCKFHIQRFPFTSIVLLSTSKLVLNVCITEGETTIKVQTRAPCGCMATQVKVPVCRLGLLLYRLNGMRKCGAIQCSLTFFKSN